MVAEQDTSGSDKLLRYGRPQAWARGGTCPPPLWQCCKVFCALVITAKRSVDELFMHYFHNQSSASGGFAPKPSPGIYPWTPLGDLSSPVP